MPTFLSSRYGTPTKACTSLRRFSSRQPRRVCILTPPPSQIKYHPVTPRAQGSLGAVSESSNIDPDRKLSCQDAVSRNPGKLWPVLATAICLVGVSLLLPGTALASAGEKLATSFRGRIPDWLIVLCISSFPIVELRGAIPVSVAVLGMEPLKVLGLAILGNMIPVPFILLFLGPLSNALSRFEVCKKAFDRIFERSRNQGAAWKKNEFWALTLFVGLPLPGTGAWSGAIGAFVLGMPFLKAIFANLLGVCLAGGIVTSLTMLGWKGLAIAIVVFIGIPAIAMLRGGGGEEKAGTAVE
ncbi:hypothetical protein BSKO_06581 [Bryopsis sp. KO-2023]|nr:hypothetical protein BSKO_06581 [Bryopsis sp. KO-2023]